VWGGYGDRHSLADGLQELASRVGKLRRMGSAQTSLGFLAAGGFDGAIGSLSPSPWDTVAGVHLVRQAGGRVTNADGGRWQHADDWLVASNGAVHEQLLDAVAALRARRE
jgi:myo-inositol-1(or 4)-monophosphatase